MLRHNRDRRMGGGAPEVDGETEAEPGRWRDREHSRRGVVRSVL